MRSYVPPDTEPGADLPIDLPDDMPPLVGESPDERCLACGGVIPPGAAHLTLKGGECVILDAADLALVSPHSWYAHNNGYARATISGQHVYMHRLILQTPHGKLTDHINGNKLDNRRTNLRAVTARQNAQNMGPKGKSSKFKGVKRIKQNSWERWMVTIRVDGKATHIGYFTDELEAALAYDAAARAHHGEFARLNFPRGTCPACNKHDHDIQACPEIRALLFAQESVKVESLPRVARAALGWAA